MTVTAPTPTLTPPDATTAPPAGRRAYRVLQVAHTCHPDESMESRIGWYRAAHAARVHDVTVLHGAPAADGLLAERAAELGLGDRLRFVGVDRCGLGKLLNRTATTYYLGYHKWHQCVYKEARRRHRESPFDLVHQTTYSGYREPGLGWKLGAPFVWGPLGGTQSFPTAYLGQLSPRGAWIEFTRNAINAWQLRYSLRVGRALKRSAVVLAATRRVADDLRRARGLEAPVQLETALDIPIGPPREPRQPGDPLRILWSGRLREWKTLPLLLRALPLLPEGLDWRLRVMGVGPSEGRWRRLADRLGVADRVEWIGWPDYRQTLPHYRWADAFAFTSMRDTSGTGLLEALAAGTPIVGVDHQGAADILNDRCAVRVPVDGPERTIAALAEGLTRLADDRQGWLALSEGARREALKYGWESQAEPLLAWYDEACASRLSGAPPRRASSGPV